MRRSQATSFSFVIGVVFLFLLLLAFVLLLTNQFLLDFLKKPGSVSGPMLVLSVAFIAALLGILGFYVVRLVQDLRRNVFGIRFKFRLMLFFVAVSLLSSVPTLILTANLLRNAFDVWFVRDTTDSMEFGAGMVIRYYQEKSHGLMSLTSSEVLPGLLRGMLEDPEEGFRRMQELNNDLSAIQIFEPALSADRPPRVLAAAGERRLWLLGGDLRWLLANQVNKTSVDGYTVLRTISHWQAERGRAPYQLVLSSSLPDDYDPGASLISSTQRRLVEVMRLPLSLPLLVFALYVLFLLPLLLIAVMVSFYLADEVVRPLVQLEQAVNRVAQGDYSTRLLSRKHDPMGHFVASFNEMVGELEHSRNDLKQSERLQTWQDIAQRMAHEIKNPLTPIKLSAERMRRKYQQGSEDFPRILEEGVGTIIQEVGAISGLLTEFRDFARLPQPVLGLVSLRELVRSTWLMYETNQAVQLDLEGVPEDLALSLDKGQMMQVFKNLFQNAIDAIGSGPGKVYIRCFRLNRMGQHVVRMQVQDTGGGIPPDLLRDIFNPYFTTKKQGSGLGLAIVEKIVLDHGGRIWAESQPGQGTSFFIDLPAKAGPGGTT